MRMYYIVNKEYHMITTINYWQGYMYVYVHVAEGELPLMYQ